ncbi:pyruvate dehydrogenase E1 component alpha subunit [Jatrophihabitans sp. GAS493]|uniref:thiamine pyrophosphate-dependent dehydrogenase E1 component subunit alpha n=1 Tax=Jatrophihabitans sp. GAS493 TaxID=1907575 RepID=UPI000BB684E4|nr:thiamine pyrophosphate-dependent dehydrogenase E1 component subunit alpha [Jatrophihabitans sp. GAS493]SOD71363.1 pyruvate dehydrogenase E1 component alpha subunit [Jatrophihabitans sp. GAS493]
MTTAFSKRSIANRDHRIAGRSERSTTAPPVEAVAPQPHAGAGAADPDPDMIQLLTPEGDRVEHPDFPLSVTDAEIADMYRDLFLVRRVDTEAIALQRQGELGLWASLLGQEGAQIGAGRALRTQDMAFPTYREHGVGWCRGIDPLTQLGLFRGTTAGGWDPFEHNFALYTIVIGAQTLHAAGYAMGVQRDRAVATGNPDTDTAVLAFFGDGASSQGSVNESFIWSAAQNLPVVYFCQNNQWAISAPVSTQTSYPLYRRASGFGFSGVRIDGNDVLASLAVTRHALDRARSGGGPMLIEAFTYRMNPHTTSDDPGRYRESADVEEWRQRDPIARVRAYLTRHAGYGDDFFADIDAEAQQLAERLRSGCRELAEPAPLSMFDHVYSELTDELREQRAQLGDFLDSLGDSTDASHGASQAGAE